MQSYTLSLTFVLAGGWWLTPLSACLRKWPGTRYMGGWMGPRFGLGGCEKSRPHRDSISRPSSTQRVSVPSTLSRPIREPHISKFIEGQSNTTFTGNSSATLLQCKEKKRQHTETAFNRFLLILTRSTFPKERLYNFFLGKETFETQCITFKCCLLC